MPCVVAVVRVLGSINDNECEAWCDFNQENTYILYILKVKHHQCGYAHLIL